MRGRKGGSRYRQHVAPHHLCGEAVGSMICRPSQTQHEYPLQFVMFIANHFADLDNMGKLHMHTAQQILGMDVPTIDM